jgi:hypothetical protein
MGYSFYDITVKNRWLFTDEEAEKRLKSSEYKLVADYGIDKKLLIYIPYIPLQII